MSKDRLQAFYDAMLAIIMTIIVLEIVVPDNFTEKAFYELVEQVVAYAISFFWLATMWVGQHNQMQMVSRIGIRTPWVFMLLLFFCSFIPFLTHWVAHDFFNPWVQLVYGIDVIAISAVNSLMYRSLMKANPDNAIFRDVRKRGEKITMAETAIKIVGIVVGFLVFPPATLVCVVISGCIDVYEELRGGPGRKGIGRKEQIKQAQDADPLVNN